MGRSRKGAGESDKSLYGWTNAVVAKIVQCESDEERLGAIRQVVSVSETDYCYDMKATAIVDYHLANLLYALEQGYSQAQTQFVMRVMTKLWEDAVRAVQGQEAVEFDQLRGTLAEELRPMFAEYNAAEDRFTKVQTQALLKYIDQAFLKPIRLITYPFRHEPQLRCKVEERKVFMPVTPDPLSECVEDEHVFEGDYEFPLLPFPRHVSSMTLKDMKEMIEQYTNNVIDIINKRYDLLEQEVAKMESSQPSEEVKAS